VIYLVIDLVQPHGRRRNQQSLGISGLVHEKARRLSLI